MYIYIHTHVYIYVHIYVYTYININLCIYLQYHSVEGTDFILRQLTCASALHLLLEQDVKCKYVRLKNVRNTSFKSKFFMFHRSYKVVKLKVCCFVQTYKSLSYICIYMYIFIKTLQSLYIYRDKDQEELLVNVTLDKKAENSVNVSEISKLIIEKVHLSHRSICSSSSHSSSAVEPIHTCICIYIYMYTYIYINMYI
jgi:hypothetical protein